MLVAELALVALDAVTPVRCEPSPKKLPVVVIELALTMLPLAPVIVRDWLLWVTAPVKVAPARFAFAARSVVRFVTPDSGTLVKLAPENVGAAPELMACGSDSVTAVADWVTVTWLAVPCSTAV